MAHPKRCYVAFYPRAITLIASAFFFFFSSVGSAQQPDPTRMRFETRLLAGVSFLGGFNAYSRGIPMVYAPICNNLEAGSDYGYGGGIALEYLLSPSLSLTMHARYGNYPGSFHRLEPIGQTSIKEDGEDGYIVVDIPSKIEFETLEADVLLKWGGSIAATRRVRAGVAFGGSASYPIAATMSQQHILRFYDTEGDLLTQRYLEDQGGEEVARRTLADKEEMPRMKWQRYGLRAGVFLDYELGAGVYMTPGFYADFPLTTFSDFQWGSLSLYQLQVDLTVGI